MSKGFEPATRWVDEIERHLSTLETYKGEYLNRCKSVRELISDCYDAAKEAGIPRVELRGVIKERALLRQIENIREDMEPEQAETFDQIKFALGMLADLPLGEVALARSDAIDSLTDEDEGAAAAADPEAEAGEANAAKLRAGISLVKA